MSDRTRYPRNSRLDNHRDSFFADFDRQEKKVFKLFGAVAILGLAFWAFVITVVVLILLHFHII